MAYRGRYIPTYPKKYKGDPSNIIYRSLWERKFMGWCDLNENVIEWGSEEIIIPYRSRTNRTDLGVYRLLSLQYKGIVKVFHYSIPFQL